MDETDKTKCYFCEDKVDPSAGTSFANKYTDVECWVCPRCGPYILLSTFYQNEPGFRDPANKFKIACILQAEYKKRGPRKPVGIFHDSFELGEEGVKQHLDRCWRFSEILAKFPKPTEMMDRILERLVQPGEHPVKPNNIPISDMSHTFLSPGTLYEPMMHQMVNARLIDGTASSGTDGSYYIVTITPKGWQRLEELQQVNTDSQQGFIAMWFDPTMDTIRDEGLQEGIGAAGYNPCVVRDVEHNDKVCDEIMAQIRQSRFVVADFTAGRCPQCTGPGTEAEDSKPIIPRGGVYFEAGFAMGLGIPVIWTVDEKQMKHVHFDTNHYNHITYTNPADLQKKLKNRIEATIGKGPIPYESKEV